MTPNFQHKELAEGRWAEMSFAEQMLNIGSEVSRANRWRSKGNEQQCLRSADRALELVSLSIDCCKKSSGLKELCRLYEIMADFYYGNNIYDTNADSLQHYFDAFYYASKRQNSGGKA